MKCGIAGGVPFMKLEDRDGGDNDENKNGNERDKHSSGSMVTVFLKPVADLVPPCM